MIRRFFRICRLLSRHAATLWHIRTCGSFSRYASYSADTRNTNSSNDLWQIRSSDYSADTRNSHSHEDLWLRRFFTIRRGARTPPNVFTARPGASRGMVNLLAKENALPSRPSQYRHQPRRFQNPPNPLRLGLDDASDGYRDGFGEQISTPFGLAAQRFQTSGASSRQSGRRSIAAG